MVTILKTTGKSTLAGLSLLALSAGLASASPLKAYELPHQNSVVQVAATNQGGAVERGAFDFVKSVTDRGLKFLSGPSAGQPAKQAEFRGLLDSSFDLNTISRFVLGRYWNTATPAQQKEYQQLFRNMIVDTYSARFTEYKGQQLDVKSYRSIGKGDTLVTSYMIPANGGEQVQIDWRVRKNGAAYKIVDVIVAGVSMSVTQRSDFASVIQRGGGNIEALLTELRNGRSAAAPK